MEGDHWEPSQKRHQKWVLKDDVNEGESIKTSGCDEEHARRGEDFWARGQSRAEGSRWSGCRLCPVWGSVDHRATAELERRVWS